jgi:hypothetical protein
MEVQKNVNEEGVASARSWSNNIRR